MEVIRLRYGNTNTFFVRGDMGGLLVDTDMAGSMGRFFKALKRAGIRMGDISWAMATHFHPDHAGLLGEMQAMGVRVLLLKEQEGYAGYSDRIYERMGAEYRPVDRAKARVIPCGESRAFLAEMGIGGEILHTPSHSPDSVALVLDDGECLVGDLEPWGYLEGYGENEGLRSDWERIMGRGVKRVWFGHANEKWVERVDE